MYKVTICQLNLVKNSFNKLIWYLKTLNSLISRKKLVE